MNFCFGYTWGIDNYRDDLFSFGWRLSDSGGSSLDVTVHESKMPLTQDNVAQYKKVFYGPEVPIHKETDFYRHK